MQSASLLLFLFSTEFSPLLVSTKDPVPPAKGASIVTVEVVVVKVMKSSTCNRFEDGDYTDIINTYYRNF